MNPTLKELWRVSAFRLATLFGFVFTIGNIAVLGLIYWQTSSYLEHRVDGVIVAMAGSFHRDEPEQVVAQINEELNYDPRKTNIYALFGPDRKPLAGNLDILPQELPLDGSIHNFTRHDLSESAPASRGGGPVLVRAMAKRLHGGAVLVIGRDFTGVAEVQSIILQALIVSGAVIIVIGLLSGLALGLGPLRRINAIRETSRRIMQGELSLRMPVSTRQDELDTLAAIVNLMLDESERLLTEVKSVTDTLAHDLRTPLTRVRLLLQRIQQQFLPGHAEYGMLDKALTETDALLARFRALLRISAIESRQRKAGFGAVDLRTVLAQVAELFDALAEDKAVRLELVCEAVDGVHGDPELLFEAISNLVDNAIKFTPAGGKVMVRLSQTETVPRIDIVDTGCGIDAGEREAILQRFYRGRQHQDHEGYGLGLSIAAAVIRLHGYVLEFQDVADGTHVTVFCKP